MAGTVGVRVGPGPADGRRRHDVRRGRRLQHPFGDAPPAYRKPRPHAGGWVGGAGLGCGPGLGARHLLRSPEGRPLDCRRGSLSPLCRRAARWYACYQSVQRCSSRRLPRCLDDDLRGGGRHRYLVAPVVPQQPPVRIPQAPEPGAPVPRPALSTPRPADTEDPGDGRHVVLPVLVHRHGRAQLLGGPDGRPATAPAPWPGRHPSRRSSAPGSGPARTGLP